MADLLRAGFAAAVLLAAPVSAEARHTTQYHDIQKQDADALLEKVKRAQSCLRAQNICVFRLRSGSVASYEKTKVPPRDAFLALDFDMPWSIARLPSPNSNWNPHMITLPLEVEAPEGMGGLRWEVEVILGPSGDVEQIDMMYAPAPIF